MTSAKLSNQPIQSCNQTEQILFFQSLNRFITPKCQNIFNMIEFDLEAQINDLLTIFLQNFKNIFAAKMSLIESICCNNSSLQSNPQYLLSRLSNKSFKFQWSLDPYSFIITQEIISNIQRFYLRIQQYLEFRLNTVINLEDKAFNKQVEIFQRNMNKLVSSLENTIMTTSVGDFFSQFSKVEIAFTSKLLELIAGKNHSLTRGPLDYESLADIRALIENKICKQQLSMFREKKIVVSLPPPPSREKRLSLRFKDDDSKLKILVRKKVSSKVQGPRQSSLPRSQNYQFEDNTSQNNWDDSKGITPQDETVDLSSYVQKQSKVKMERVYDILEIDLNCKIVTKQEIMQDLEGKNAKNKILIQKYISKYQKKQKRVLRRQRSEKESKSTVKSSKVPAKNQDWNIFSAKLQNSQHQYLSRFKSNNQNLKKYEQFELPLIVSQKNRRTTVQK